MSASPMAARTWTTTTTNVPFLFRRAQVVLRSDQQHDGRSRWEFCRRDQHRDQGRNERNSWRRLLVCPELELQRDELLLHDLDNLKRNQTGFTLGGPIRKNKLFAFGGFQQLWIRSAPGSLRAQTPTAAERQGDFSGTSIIIGIPATGGRTLAIGSLRIRIPGRSKFDDRRSTAWP